MKILECRSLSIPAVKTISFARFHDQRGYFTESSRLEQLRQVLGDGFQVRQSNESHSKAGVIRGLHFQWSPYMGKLVRVVRGRMLDLVLDLREGSPTAGMAIAHEMSADPKDQGGEWIWVPPGFAHGNAFLEETVIEYLCTGAYSMGCEACISPLAEDIDWSLCGARAIALLNGAVSTGFTMSDKDRGGRTVRQWFSSKEAAQCGFKVCPEPRPGASPGGGALLVTGGSGLLGRELRKALPPGTLFPTRAEFDVTCLPQMFEYLEGKGVWGILHAAALTAPLKVDKRPSDAIEANVKGTANVSQLCAARGLKLLYVSTDYVFEGDAGMYREGDALLPQNKYAWSKLGGECAARLCPGAVIARLSFGPSPFPHPRGGPSPPPHLARLVECSGGIEGPIHLGGPRRTVEEYAKGLGGPQPVGRASVREVEERGGVRLPRDTSLDTSKFRGIAGGAPPATPIGGGGGAGVARDAGAGAGAGGGAARAGGSLGGGREGGRRKVLVIGGAGYIGSRLCAELSRGAQPCSVTVVDALWFGNHLGEGSCERVIKTDYSALTEDFLAEFDAVILLAGHSSVKMCLGQMGPAFRNNVARAVGLMEKLEKAREGGRRIKFVYASSSSVYGNADGASPVSEAYPIDSPNNWYDLSKLTLDQWASMSPLESYGLRFGTVCGSSPNLRCDVMINSMVGDAILKGEVRLYVAAIRRPVLGIRDLCRAVGAIVGCEEDRRGIYNLASFNGTVEEYGKAVAEALGVPVRRLTVEKVEKMTNVKLQSKQYDFAISSDLFKRAFGFEFEESVGSIVRELVEAYPGAHYSTRDTRKSAL